MKLLGKDQIREEFNARKTDICNGWKKKGSDQALQDLGCMIDDLKEAGMDVSLEMSGDASEQAFIMCGAGKRVVDCEGILRIGNDYRLLAIVTQVNSVPCCSLCLSKFDIRHNGGGEAVRALIYDLKNDPDAMIELEKEIIDQAARNEAVEDNLDARRHLAKPGAILRKSP